jgi:hypothetical protein
MKLYMELTSFTNNYLILDSSIKYAFKIYQFILYVP